MNAAGRPVVVVGAGVIGAATALVLQRAGFTVTLVDRGEPGMECSFGNGGAISPDFCVPSALPGILKRVPKWFADPLGPLVVRWSDLPRSLPWLLRWVRESDMARVEASSNALRALHGTCLDLYPKLLGNEAHGLIETTGQLYVWKSAAASPTEALSRALRDRHGIVTHALDEARIREMDPELAPGFVRGLHFPDNGHTVNPLRLVQTLVRLLVQAGGRQMRLAVREFEREGDRVSAVVGEDGLRLPAAHVIVATGIRGADTARKFGDSIPLQAERGYSAMLPDPKIRPVIKISNRDHMFGLAPMELGVRVAGTVEIAGPDAPMDPRRAEALLVRAKQMYPRLNTEGAQIWMGSRPSTPDSLPVIGRARGASNMIYAFGHGHTGLTGAPMTAEIVRSILTDSPPPIDATPYRPTRF